jgi:hypothetical protein
MIILQLRTPENICYHWAKKSMEGICVDRSMIKTTFGKQNRTLLRMLCIPTDVSFKEGNEMNIIAHICNELTLIISVHSADRPNCLQSIRRI